MSQYIQKYATEATYNVGMQNTNLGGGNHSRRRDLLDFPVITDESNPLKHL